MEAIEVRQLLRRRNDRRRQTQQKDKTGPANSQGITLISISPGKKIRKSISVVKGPHQFDCGHTDISP
jgi:hypothetical protein